MRAKTDDDLKPSMSGRKPANGPRTRMQQIIEKMHGKPPRVGSTMFVRLPPLSNQLAVVVNSKHVTGAENHARYIEREGVGENGERPISFSHDQDEVKAVSVVKEWNTDEVHYRRVLPLMSQQDLDPKAYAKGYISKLEKDFKMPAGSIHYVACVHHNTAQTHVHIMIRGRDHLGRKLDIADSYAHQIEWRRASDAATELVGHRTYREIAESVKKEQERYEQGISHPELELSGGWHLNINVSINRKDPFTQDAMAYMREQNIRYDMNFQTNKTEVLVAKVGSYDRLQRIANEMEERLGHGLKPVQSTFLREAGLVLNEHMTATFRPKGDRDFSQITSKGLPILKEHARGLKDLPLEQKMALALRHRDHADRELMERYGEFYGGKERTSALERLHTLKREGHEYGL